MPHWTNYHQHCYYCDGTDAPEVYVEEALKQNVASFGFSSHAPVPFDVFWCIKPHHYDGYFDRISKIKQDNAHQLPIFVGLEVDYIPNIISPTDQQFKRLDYRIGSVHLVDVGRSNEHIFWEIDGPSKEYVRGLAEFFDNNIERAVGSYFAATRQMLEHHTPEVLGHMDKVKMNNKGQFFKETDTWYQQQVLQTLETAKAAKVIIEVNTRSVYKKKCDVPYPSPWVLEHIHQMNIPICLNSDAHHPSEITKQFAETALLLQQIGFKHLYIQTKNGWEPRPFSAQGIEL